MNNAKLYQKSNLLQRRDADLLMNEFSSIFVHHKEHARLLDVGCGPGDVLIELLLPHLHHPSDSSMQIVGADISQEMVEHAREKYRSMSKFIRFLKVDIESDFLTATKRITGSDELKAETFDFVTSFYCLHWVQNQSKAISNIHKLLKPNGTCFLAFIVSMPIFDIYLELSEMKKFAPYMKDVKNYVSPYHFEAKPLETFTERLYDSDFKIVHVEIRNQIFVYDNAELLKFSVKAVNPFSGRMPENLQNEFLDEYVRCVETMQLVQYNELTGMESIITPYKLMVAIARK